MITEDAVIGHVFLKIQLYSIDCNKSRFFFEKKCYNISKWLLNQKIQSKTFISSYILKIVSLYREIAIYLKKSERKVLASKTQRHLDIFYSPYSILKHHGVRVSLRLLLNIFLNQTINPKAQSKKISFVKKENLNSSYVFTGFVPSGLFYIYIYIDICTKKVTGPKRLRSNVSPMCCQLFFLFSFGAFFLAAYKSLPIKSRRGVGAISMHFTSFCYYGCLTFVTKKRSAIACCTSAVFFFFLFFARYVCLMYHSNSKNLKMEGICINIKNQIRNKER